MKLTDLLSDIGRPVAFYPGLRKLTKSTTATLFLCQLIYWTDKQIDPNGWIYKTSEEIEEETGLTYDEQKTARASLLKSGFIKENYKRLEHQMYFKVNRDMINDTWDNSPKWKQPIPEHGNAKMGKMASPHSLNESENTTKNTSENTYSPEKPVTEPDRVSCNEDGIELSIKEKKKNKYLEHLQNEKIGKAISEVSGLNYEANKIRLKVEAKALLKAGDVTAEKIIQDYGPGGLWYKTWMGRNGAPGYSQVRSTWGTLEKHVNLKSGEVRQNTTQQKSLENIRKALMDGDDEQ